MATMMLDLASKYPEYKASAANVKILETTSGEYYGKGYQDVQNRVPKIDNTMKDLGWTPTVNMADALKGIFDSYRQEIEEAKHLVD